MEELPHLRDLYGRLYKQGFGMISVNEGDSSATIRKYAKENKYTFPIVMNKAGGPDVVSMYKVTGFPTNYLLDRKGKIIASFLGFDEEGMKKALRKAGFKL